MIFTVTLNPAVDRELTVEDFAFDTVLRASAWRMDCGGKGFNVARMLISLGAPCIALGFAAGRSGGMLADKLAELGIETDFVWVTGETRTNVSIVSSKTGRYVKVNEPGPEIDADQLHLMTEKIRSRVRPDDLWVLAGSLPPGVPPGYYGQLINIIQSAGARVFLDTSDAALKESCGAGPLLVKPNGEEAHQLTGRPVTGPLEIAEAGRAVMAMGPKSVVISLGKKGAVLVEETAAWFAASPVIEERNPIGAGDSMVAGLAWGLSRGLTLLESLRWGIACGAATAGRSGTAVGSIENVNALLSHVQVTQL